MIFMAFLLSAAVHSGGRVEFCVRVSRCDNQLNDDDNGYGRSFPCLLPCSFRRKDNIWDWCELTQTSLPSRFLWRC